MEHSQVDRWPALGKEVGVDGRGGLKGVMVEV